MDVNHCHTADCQYPREQNRFPLRGHRARFDNCRELQRLPRRTARDYEEYGRPRHRCRRSAGSDTLRTTDQSSRLSGTAHCGATKSGRRSGPAPEYSPEAAPAAIAESYAFSMRQTCFEVCELIYHRIFLTGIEIFRFISIRFDLTGEACGRGFPRATFNRTQKLPKWKSNHEIVSFTSGPRSASSVDFPWDHGGDDSLCHACIWAIEPDRKCRLPRRSGRLQGMEGRASFEPLGPASHCAAEWRTPHASHLCRASLSF